MVTQWPPNVWHGVVDPRTGEKVDRVKLNDSPQFTRGERKTVKEW